MADRDITVQQLHHRTLELDAARKDVTSLREELADMALVVHEQRDVTSTAASVPTPPPPSVQPLDVTPSKNQLNVVFAGIQQVLSTRQQKRL